MRFEPETSQFLIHEPCPVKLLIFCRQFLRSHSDTVVSSDPVTKFTLGKDEEEEEEEVKNP